jgi:hypothetical protein
MLTKGNLPCNIWKLACTQLVQLQPVDSIIKCVMLFTCGVIRSRFADVDFTTIIFASGGVCSREACAGLTINSTEAKNRGKASKMRLIIFILFSGRYPILSEAGWGGIACLI